MYFLGNKHGVGKSSQCYGHSSHIGTVESKYKDKECFSTFNICSNHLTLSVLLSELDGSFHIPGIALHIVI